jgi:hypothetical protein
MEAYFSGPMPNDDFFQALWQFRHDFIDRYAGSVQIKEATIHLTFCDERGAELTLYNEHGRRIKLYKSPRAYQSAADFYEAQSLESQILTVKDQPIRHVPFSPL